MIDVNNSVVANLNVEEKIRIFNIFLDSIVKRGVDKELLNVSLLFNKIMDLDNINLERSINELYKKVMFLYSKPNIDIKEILSISELLSNRLDTKSFNNEFVKEELKKRLYYI